MASSPRVPGSGTELPPLEPESVWAGHMDGIQWQLIPAWAAGAPIAMKAAANKLNVILLTVPPTYV